VRWAPPGCVETIRPFTARIVSNYVQSMLPSAGEMFDIEAMSAAGVYKSPQDRDLQAPTSASCTGRPPTNS
jgi:hypothetical protein